MIMQQSTKTRRRSAFLLCVVVSGWFQAAHPFSTTSLSLSLVSSSSPLAYLASLAVSSVPQATGGWAEAKLKLRHPECCVVSVSGLESHLQVLQDLLADRGPAELDLRARVHVRSTRYEDCLQIRQSVTTTQLLLPMRGEDHTRHKKEEERSLEEERKDPCTAALEELARGMASLSEDGPYSLDLEGGVCEDVFLRIVCASDYRARDPPFHTDKAPLRGYVTLRGIGTEFMPRPCSPLEYITLRTFGGSGELAKEVRQAGQLDFIVMKGDYYEAPPPSSKERSGASPFDFGTKKLWQRATACVHRSPPGTGRHGRRVIISLDLADGDDDREWYQAGKKREWRSGMTQRKSRLVS